MTALLTGIVYDSLCIGTDSNPNLTPQLESYAEDFWPPHISDFNYNLVGFSFTRNYLSDITWAITSGRISETYFYDFYFRVHFSPLAYDLGYILSDQNYPGYIWNAFLDSTVTLDSIEVNSLPDLILSPSVTLPYTINANQEIVFNINVPVEGEDNIAGSYIFTFSDSSTRILNIIGSRAVLWPFAPNRDFSETREWNTDIVYSMEGEQRFARRGIARTTYNYNFTLKTDSEYAIGKKIGKFGAKKNIGLPIWSDIIKVTNLISGQTIIPFDTTFSEFTEGSSVIIYKNYTTYEIKTIASITSDSLILVQQLLYDFPVAYLAPIRLGRALGGIKMELNENHAKKAAIQLLTTDTYTLEGIPSTETFLTYPVLNTVPVISGGLSDTFTRELESIDFLQGEIYYYEQETYVRSNKNIRFVSRNLKEFYSLRRFFDYFKGKLNAVWVPSYFDDLLPYDTSVYSGSAQIRVKSGHWTNYGYDNIRVEGSINLNLNVIAIADNADGTETLTFTPALSQNISNIKRISILTLMRFNSDNIEFQHGMGEIIFTNVPLIEIKA